MIAVVFSAAALALAGGAALHVGAAGSPHVVSTYPAPGSVVRPGRVELRVVFDRPMRADSYSFTRVATAAYPDCAGAPVRSSDGRAFGLSCALQPRTSYAVGFNSVRYRNFVSADDGAPARPRLLRFSTW